MISYKLMSLQEIGDTLRWLNREFVVESFDLFPKILSRYIKKGFRLERVRNMDNEMYNTVANALYRGDEPITTCFLEAILQLFKDSGIDEYVSNRKEGVSNEIMLTELMTFVLGNSCPCYPAHVFKLYGVVLTDEETERSNKLYIALTTRLEKGIGQFLEEAKKNAEAECSKLLEAERDKNAQLQKKIDGNDARIKELEKNLRQSKDDNKSLSGEVAPLKERVEELEKELKSVEREVTKKRETIDAQLKELGQLKHDREKHKADYDKLESKYLQLQEEASKKISLDADEIRGICRNAIDCLGVNDGNRAQVLAMAKQRFIESDGTKEAWDKLCDSSAEIVNGLVDKIAEGRFELSDFDSFDELESLLLLESAIKQSLYAVAHKVAASTVEQEPLRGNFTVQDQGSV